MIIKKGKMSELYAAMVEEAQKEEVQDGEFTSAQFAKDAGISRWLACDRLRKLVEEGRVTTREAMLGSRTVNAYKIAE